MLPIIELSDVTKRYKKTLAVDHVSFSLTENEALGLVGESGCGKTTLANMILGLLDPTEGSVSFRGIPLLKMNRKEKTDYRRQVQLVFQDTKASLNPGRSIRQSIAEPMHNYKTLTKAEEFRAVGDLMEKVGLSPADMERFPDSFSGGQRQRVAIARALALEPALLVLDEATSSLDVSVQAQILNLLRELKEKTGMSYLVISHDLGVVRYLSDRIIVMNSGKLEEQIDAADLEMARSPYTQMLIRSVPDIQNRF